MLKDVMDLFRYVILLIFLFVIYWSFAKSLTILFFLIILAWWYTKVFFEDGAEIFGVAKARMQWCFCDRVSLTE